MNMSPQDEFTKFAQVFDQLPPRRKEILLKLVAGEADDEIAKSLEIHPGTVRKQISSLCNDFGLTEPDGERRSKRGDLISLVARYKPELLGIKVVQDSSLNLEVSPSCNSSNPFIPISGVIDDPQLFFNRNRELERIFELLNIGSNVSVVGEDRIGKSSLLREIKRRAISQLKPKRKAIYMDLQSVSDENEFYQNLCDEIGIEETHSGYQLKRFLKKQENKFLLFLDEFEKIAGKEFQKVHTQLRGLADGFDAHFRIITASQESLSECLSFYPETKTSPFYNIFIEEKLNSWDEQTSFDFIKKRLESTSIEFTLDEQKRIIEDTGGHPQKLMEKCHNLYEKYEDQKNDV